MGRTKDDRPLHILVVRNECKRKFISWAEFMVKVARKWPDNVGVHPYLLSLVALEEWSYGVVHRQTQG
jgi:hypothetical protein